jgi:membrane protein implicated in regulation of membrane protease activity
MVIVMGLYTLSVTAWICIASILLLGLIILGCYTYKLYKRIPKNYTPLIGQEAIVTSWQGRDKRVEVFGAIWSAEIIDPHTTEPNIGDVVIVRGIDNLTLQVTPVYISSHSHLSHGDAT